MSSPTRNSFAADFLVLGSGVAGASVALKLAECGNVILVCKAGLEDTNTVWAQGGIASVLSHEDSFDAHVADTLEAGAGLCHEGVVRKVVEAGPRAIRELISMGVQFTKHEEILRSGGAVDFHLAREGGHSARRVIHTADMTGRELQRVLSEQVRRHPAITVLTESMAVDLIVTDKSCPDFTRNRCLGAYVLEESTGQVRTLLARATILATGGHGKLYLFTSNPDLATGDGVAMAYRAGARIANLEFMQFHPTCLYNSKAKNFLITEALRGEGAVLRTMAGESLMDGQHPLGALAPRDIVARAIDSHMKRSGDPYVLLDISHRPPDFVRSHFPGVHEKCLSLGIDITREAIPVVPAAHYSCGGVVTDERGRTGIKSLWALGEAACTGLHGANRLASNSLLEGLVFADFVASDIRTLLPDLRSFPALPIPDWELGKACEPDEMVVISQLWDEIRRTMWNYVGIVRSDKRLARAEARIRQLVDEIEDYYWDIVPSRALLEVRNLASVALLTVKCARARKESRGIHFSLDFPGTDDKRFRKDTVLS